MAIPLKADIIYFDTLSDFEFEFYLSGSSPMRLLSAKAKDNNEFLHAMKTAVGRSQIIVVVGALSDGLALDRVCEAIGYKKATCDTSELGGTGDVDLPEKSIPLISSDGAFGGCVIECGPQSIIVITDEKELRKQLMRELLQPYISTFSAAQTGTYEIKKVQSVQPQQPKEEKKHSSAEIDHQFILREPNKKEHDFSQLEKEILSDDRKNKKGFKVFASIIWTLIFITAGVCAYIFLAEPLIADNLNSNYSAMYKGDLDFTELKSVNPDTIGFLKIEGTSISLPVVNEPQQEQVFYYKHRYFNEFLTLNYGTPNVKASLSQRNVVIYGGKGTFSPLEKLSTLSGYRVSPIIQFDTIDGAKTYKIFAVLKGENAKTKLRTQFANDSDFLKYANELVADSAIHTAVTLAPQDEMITLISDGDFAVFARLIRDGESDMVDTKNAYEQ